MYTYPDYEEDTCKDRSRHGMQHYKKRPGHRPPDRHAHQEVRHALFDHVFCLDNRLPDLGDRMVLRLYHFQVRLVVRE
jgi:hypothetical protein